LNIAQKTLDWQYSLRLITHTYALTGYENAAFKFTVAAYGSLSNWTVSKGLGCSSTIWGPDDAPIYGESR